MKTRDSGVVHRVGFRVSFNMDLSTLPSRVDTRAGYPDPRHPSTDIGREELTISTSPLR